MSVSPGEYEHRAWAFTRPGTYVIAVHAKGRPQKGDGKLLPANSQIVGVTSEVQHYTFHVGKLADVGVNITPEDQSVNPGGTATFTITASNSGPNEATDTEVQVTLPEGLDFAPTVPPTDGVSASNDGRVVTWDVDTLNAPTKNANGDLIPTTATLTINASVATGHRGDALTATARISATETIGGSVVTELDPRLDDNTSIATVAVPYTSNVNPIFRIKRSVNEDAAANATVGSPVLVRSGDNDPLHYTIVGDGAENFDVNNDGQITITDPPGINHECQATYPLTLEVSDHKDAPWQPGHGS